MNHGSNTKERIIKRLKEGKCCKRCLFTVSRVRNQDQIWTTWEGCKRTIKRFDRGRPKNLKQHVLKRENAKQRRKQAVRNHLQKIGFTSRTAKHKNKVPTGEGETIVCLKLETERKLKPGTKKTSPAVQCRDPWLKSKEWCDRPVLTRCCSLWRS